ncbi:hypothetical protein ACFPK9_02415 [Rubritalea spongiae]|uniref:Uncharacterized protein n=1 Tax=Rubritalea spongiae TaxID=430797 RepID=A0ABW5E809_9BACT
MKLLLSFSITAFALLSLNSCTNTPNSGDAASANPKYPDAYPVAGDPNKVVSPYRPYNVINVKGICQGHFVRDMSTAKKGADGKPDPATAKIFRVPAPTKSAE